MHEAAFFAQHHAGARCLFTVNDNAIRLQKSLTFAKGQQRVSGPGMSLYQLSVVLPTAS